MNLDATEASGRQGLSLNCLLSLSPAVCVNQNQSGSLLRTSDYAGNHKSRLACTRFRREEQKATIPSGSLGSSSPHRSETPCSILTASQPIVPQAHGWLSLQKFPLILLFLESTLQDPEGLGLHCADHRHCFFTSFCILHAMC